MLNEEMGNEWFNNLCKFQACEVPDGLMSKQTQPEAAILNPMLCMIEVKLLFFPETNI